MSKNDTTDGLVTLTHLDRKPRTDEGVQRIHSGRLDLKVRMVSHPQHVCIPLLLVVYSNRLVIRQILPNELKNGQLSGDFY